MLENSLVSFSCFGRHVHVPSVLIQIFRCFKNPYVMGVNIEKFVYCMGVCPFYCNPSILVHYRVLDCCLYLFRLL
jgi:hypothetical protein